MENELMEAGMCYITTLEVSAESAPNNQPGSFLPLLVNCKKCNYCRRTKKRSPIHSKTGEEKFKFHYNRNSSHCDGGQVLIYL